MREVYDRAFANARYSVHRAGEPRYGFAAALAAEWGASCVYDIGAGRQTLRLSLPDGVEYRPVDLAQYGPLPVTVADLAGKLDRIGLSADDGAMFACLDVLEHLPAESVAGAVRALQRFALRGAITVANHSDVLDGIELHLTQEDDAWWGRAIRSAGWSAAQRSSPTPRAYFFEVKR